MSKGAVVLFSGGQDSTTCLAWAHARFPKVVALSINYGQRHAVELQAADEIARTLGVERVELGVSFPPSSALNSDGAIDVKPDGGHNNLPSTFLPGRNATFLSLAASLAIARGFTDVVTGVCQTDYSGYPDCREDFVTAMSAALSLAVATPLNIHTPLMHLTKAATVRLAQELGAMPLVGRSHTCYLGKRPACGSCPACVLRAKGFAEAGVVDPAA